MELRGYLSKELEKVIQIKMQLFLAILISVSLASLLIGINISSGSSEYANSETVQSSTRKQTTAKDSSESTTTIQTNSKGSFYKVIRVIDGDTIEVETVGKVRLIGIDSPEMNNGKPECFAEEATEFMKSLISDRYVNIVEDSTQDKNDRYNRRLAYVFKEDGLLVNKEMIVNGFASEFTYRKKYYYQTEFIETENTAKQNNLGIWNLESCST